MQPLFSLIVPTRRRLGQLQRLLTSLEETAEHPEAVEVVLVVDADDPASLHTSAGGLAVKHVVVGPGLTMGALNSAGYAASRGRYLMLLNDDVVARTRGWDRLVHACFRAYPDEILLVHVNDTVFRTELCTFPIVSRKFCELAGGISPHEYLRYRIDDHIEDIFNLLGELGERRILYLPDVIFEHLNFVTHESGLRQYFSDPGILALDAPLFERLRPQRHALALRVKGHIRPGASPRERQKWRARLDAVVDSAARRPPERRVIPADRLATPASIRRDPSWLSRVGAAFLADMRKLGPCLRRSGVGGLVKAVGRRFRRLTRAGGA